MIEKEYRFEFKYYLDNNSARRIAEKIKTFGMRLDNHATRLDGGYVVTSLYFDSFNLSDYLEKVSGAYQRKKIRLRIYEPYLESSKKVFLEIKHKRDMTNRKTKIAIDRDIAEDLIQNGPRALWSKKWEDKDQRKVVIILKNLLGASAKPKTIITYIRTAYISRDKGIRITFDRDIRASSQKDMAQAKFMVKALRDAVVMEVKYQYILPFWFKNIVQDYNLKRDTFSKYEKCLESIYAYNKLLR